MAVAFVVLLLGWRLGSLYRPLPEEIAYANGLAGPGSILAQPLRAGPRLVSWAASHWMPSLLAVRATSSAIAFSAVVSCFTLARRWWGNRVAWAGSVLMVTSAWFLAVARNAFPDAQTWLLLVTLATGVWAVRQRGRLWPAAIALLAVTITLYQPAAIWFLLPVVAWRWRSIIGFWRSYEFWPRLLLLLFTMLLIAPLAFWLAGDPSRIMDWLGSTGSLSVNGRRLLCGFSHLPVWLAARGPEMADWWLGPLPLLDVATLILLIIGAAELWSRRKLDRSRLLAFWVVVGLLLAVNRGPATLSLVLPVFYLIVTGGLASLSGHWERIFPYNPLARSVGGLFIALAIGVSGLYNLSRYFVAGPRRPGRPTAYLRLEIHDRPATNASLLRGLTPPGVHLAINELPAPVRHTGFN